MVISLVMSLCVVVLAWQRRQFPGALAITALSISTFVWTLGFFLEANSDTLQRQLLFNNIGYIGSTSVPVAWFVFALQYTSGGKLLRTWQRKRRAASNSATLLELETKTALARTRWNQLYYCHRCDGVFILGAALVPIDQMSNYVYSEYL